MDITYEQYKTYEFLGDRLLSFIVSIHLMSGPVHDKFERKELIQLCQLYTCNDTLALAAKRLGIESHPEDKVIDRVGHPNKRHANAFEVYLYQLYLIEGLHKATDFVIKNLINYGTDNK